jgi:cell division septal protein FtsQ
MPVTAPTDKRFLRAHVKQGRRHGAWRRRLRIARPLVVAALVVGSGYTTARFVATARALQIDRIVITGNERLSTGEVLALLEGLRGQNILRVDLAVWRKRLLDCPWVGDATVRRLLPATVEVAVVERRPMGIGRLGGELCLIDERGAIIDEYGPKYAEFDLPLIDGLAGAPRGSGPGLDERRAALVARLLAAVRPRPELARRISQIDVTDPHDAVVILDKDTAMVRLGEEQFLERLQSYLELAPTLRERVPAIDYVDLRFGGRVFVGAAAGTESGPVAARTRSNGRPPAPF